MSFKRISLTVLICLLAAGLFGGYFYHVGKITAAGRAETTCNAVDVYILDSLESAVISRADIMDILGEDLAGVPLDSINTDMLEKKLIARGEILSSSVYTSGYGKVGIEITQRKPVVRFENATERYYSDASGYLFPVLKSLQVPVITGAIPLKLGSNFRGYSSEEDTRWLAEMAAFAMYVSADKYWSEQIGQIDIEQNGDIVLYVNCGNEKIIFGSSAGAEAKFRKLKAYYENIVPEQGSGRYSTVNLKFKNQIICK